MVIPWIGFPLASLLKRVEPTGQAKYVEFTTLLDPKQFPGQRASLFGFALDWPYTEGLRLDEALHPLTLLTVGMYGQVLPNQSGGSASSGAVPRSRSTATPTRWGTSTPAWTSGSTTKSVRVAPRSDRPEGGDLGGVSPPARDARVLVRA